MARANIKSPPCLYLDSVWIRDANLLEAVRRGAEELWVVWCLGNIGIYKAGGFNQYVDMIEISANGARFGEFDQINEINRRILQGETILGHTQPIRLHLIKPEYPLPLDPDYFLGRIDAATLIAMGYADASKYLSHKKPEGLPLQPEITQMQNPTLGITFRETMAGGFTLGETDPNAGSEQGKNNGHILAMHATITIQDLNRFIADPEHPGQLNGAVDFVPFGENIPATTGVFNLFSPTDQPGLKLMVYEMGFTANGQSYYSGTLPETADHFLNLITAAGLINSAGKTTIPIYTLAGNHDMYSGGSGYYNLLTQLGQPASFFACETTTGKS